MPLQYACTLSRMGSRLQYTCNILPTRQRSRIDEAVLHDQIYSRPGATCQPAHALSVPGLKARTRGQPLTDLPPWPTWGH